MNQNDNHTNFLKAEQAKRAAEIAAAKAVQDELLVKSADQLTTVDMARMSGDTYNRKLATDPQFFAKENPDLKPVEQRA